MNNNFQQFQQGISQNETPIPRMSIQDDQTIHKLLVEQNTNESLNQGKTQTPQDDNSNQKSQKTLEEIKCQQLWETYRQSSILHYYEERIEYMKRKRIPFCENDLNDKNDEFKKLFNYEENCQALQVGIYGVYDKDYSLQINQQNFKEYKDNLKKKNSKGPLTIEEIKNINEKLKQEEKEGLIFYSEDRVIIKENMKKKDEVKKEEATNISVYEFNFESEYTEEDLLSQYQQIGQYSNNKTPYLIVQNRNNEYPEIEIPGVRKIMKGETYNVGEVYFCFERLFSEEWKSQDSFTAEILSMIVHLTDFNWFADRKNDEEFSTFNDYSILNQLIDKEQLLSWLSQGEKFIINQCSQELKKRMQTLNTLSQNQKKRLTENGIVGDRHLTEKAFKLAYEIFQKQNSDSSLFQMRPLLKVKVVIPTVSNKKFYYYFFKNNSKNNISIGRNKECDIYFKLTSMSRRTHANITISLNNDCFIKKRDDAQMIYLKQSMAVPSIIQGGASIRFGNILYKISFDRISENNPPNNKQQDQNDQNQTNGYDFGVIKNEPAYIEQSGYNQYSYGDGDDNNDGYSVNLGNQNFYELCKY